MILKIKKNKKQKVPSIKHLILLNHFGINKNLGINKKTLIMSNKMLIIKISIIHNNQTIKNNMNKKESTVIEVLTNLNHQLRIHLHK